MATEMHIAYLYCVDSLVPKPAPGGYVCIRMYSYARSYCKVASFTINNYCKNPASLNFYKVFY